MREDELREGFSQAGVVARSGHRDHDDHGENLKTDFVFGAGDRVEDEVGDEGEEAEGGEELQKGVRRPEKKMDPREPTAQERREHELTHLPFRNWCRHCVRGRGKEEACRRCADEVEIPEVHLDFMFMGEEKGGKTIAMLTAK